jgi:hypothetical protein
LAKWSLRSSARDSDIGGGRCVLSFL